MVDDENINGPDESDMPPQSTADQPLPPPTEEIEPAPPQPVPPAQDVKPAPEPEEPGIFDELYDVFFAKSWEMWVGCIILSVLSISLFLIQSPWGSSGGLNNWGQNLLDFFGMSFPETAKNGPKDIVDYRYAMLSVTMFLGALGSALMGKQFAIRVPPNGELAKGLIGGVFMGIGAILAGGCTVGGFFTGWPALSGSALVFALGLFIGVYLGVQYLLWEMEAYPGMSSGKTYTFCAAKTDGMSYQPLVGMVVLALGAALALQYDSSIEKEKVLIGFTLIGLMIGVVIQRSRFCIVRALREPFISGDADPALGIMGGILVGLLGFSVIKIMNPDLEMTSVASSYWVPAIVGGVIFGVGMTVAGGCTIGATWRAAEGHVKLWFAMIGIIISLPLAGEFIKPAFYDALPDSMADKFFLPHTLGYGGSITLILLILMVWFIFVKWNERTGKLTAF
jgi:uncharacterized protein